MGDGDVKLARAIGALLPISQALVSFLLAIGVGAKRKKERRKVKLYLSVDNRKR